MKMNREVVSRSSAPRGVLSVNDSRWPLPLIASDLGAGLHDDVGRGADLVDEVFRHALFERVAAHQHVDLSSVAGEVHGCLPCGVGASDDVDSLVWRRTWLR